MARCVTCLLALPGRTPSALDLQALVPKYEALVQLRAQREACEGEGQRRLFGAQSQLRRERMRRLAAAFPGSLRELELDLPTLRGRLDETRAQGLMMPPPAALWLLVMSSFHFEVRRALGIKAALSKPLAAKQRCELVDEVASWYAWDARECCEDVAAVFELFRRPMGGRLMNLVWLRLEAQYDRDAAALRELLFGHA